MQKKTPEQHRLEGTQVKPTRPEQSKYEGGRPKFRTHLSKAAKVEFKKCVAILEARGTITPGDELALCVYAEVYVRWVVAKQNIADHLMIETTMLDSNGNARVVSRINPLLKVADTCESKLLAIAKTLGLTPVDRDKVKPTTDAEPENQEPKEGTAAWIIWQDELKQAALKKAIVRSEEDDYRDTGYLPN